MEKILKLFNRIDMHLQSRNTQELILDLGDSKKAEGKMEETTRKLDDEIKELQEWLDSPEASEYIYENFEVFSETFDSMYSALDIDLTKLKANSVGKESLYKHIQKIMDEKASTAACDVPYDKKKY